MAVSIEDVLLYSLTQSGDRYIFGAEAQASNPNPAAFDCSELVEWSCHRAGIAACPDGAYFQWLWTASRALSVDDGMQTRGALLFVGDGTGTGRDAITHVAWSLGDGTTIEARGSAWGVGTWPSVGRFDYAALIPGADYQEDDMTPEQSKKLDALDMRSVAADQRLGRLEAAAKRIEAALAKLAG